MKQIASRFAVAVHVLVLASECEASGTPCTSSWMAGSVSTHPVVIRRIVQALKAAGLARVRPGAGGTVPARDIASISLLDVYRAVGASDGPDLFSLHDAPNPACYVGANINAALGAALGAAQAAMEAELASRSVADVRDAVLAAAGRRGAGRA